MDRENETSQQEMYRIFIASNILFFISILFDESSMIFFHVYLAPASNIWMDHLVG